VPQLTPVWDSASSARSTPQITNAQTATTVLSIPHRPAHRTAELRKRRQATAEQHPHTNKHVPHTTTPKEGGFRAGHPHARHTPRHRQQPHGSTTEQDHAETYESRMGETWTTTESPVSTRYRCVGLLARGTPPLRGREVPPRALFTSVT
jgi:hypothetical protein